MTTVEECRALLDTATPLRRDCGRLCGAACCSPLPGEETGMLLFPTEEALYENAAGFELRPAAMGTLLICSGACDRAMRPLSCRLFPLLPVLRGESVRAEMDLRAKAVCPLFRQGLSAMSAEFVSAVEACGSLLAQDPRQRPFLEKLAEEQAELKALSDAFGA